MEQTDALYPSVPARIKAGEIDVLVMTAATLAVVAADRLSKLQKLKKSA